MNKLGSDINKWLIFSTSALRGGRGNQNVTIVPIGCVIWTVRKGRGPKTPKFCGRRLWMVPKGKGGDGRDDAWRSRPPALDSQISALTFMI